MSGKETNWRKWAEEKLNEGKPVQVAVSASNACFWAYLTTSGQVCRREFGFVEDVCEEWPETLDLPKMSWSSVCRLQDALIAAQM